MSMALLSRVAVGEVAADEVHAEWRPYHRPAEQGLGVVVGLSHGARPEGYLRPPYDDEIRAIAGTGASVVVPGSSGRAWGSEAAVESVDAAVQHLRERLGCRRRVALLGFSMGALAVCRWASDHADEVAALALVTPALDLRDHLPDPTYGPEIRAVHGDGDPVSPVDYASRLAGIRTRVWYAPADPIIAAATVERFGSLHGAAELVRMEVAGHDPAAVPGDEIAAFLTASRD